MSRDFRGLTMSTKYLDFIIIYNQDGSIHRIEINYKKNWILTQFPNSMEFVTQ